jgi:hypothetical protein
MRLLCGAQYLFRAMRKRALQKINQVYKSALAKPWQKWLGTHGGRDLT